MSILSYGKSDQQRALRRAFPSEDFSKLSPEIIPIFSEDTLYLISPSFSKFYDFLCREAGKSLSVAFEIFGYYSIQFTQLHIRIYSKFGIKNFYTAIPTAKLSYPEAQLFPTSSGSLALQFSEESQSVTALPYFSTPENVATELTSLLQTEVIYSECSSSLQFPELSKYRYLSTFLL